MKCLREFFDVLDGNVSKAALNAADVGSVQPRQLGQLFLGNLCLFANGAQTLAKSNRDCFQRTSLPERMSKKKREFDLTNMRNGIRYIYILYVTVT